MANGDYAVTNTGTDVHNSRLPDSVVVRIVAEVVNRLGYRPHTRARAAGRWDSQNLEALPKSDKDTIPTRWG